MKYSNTNGIRLNEIPLDLFMEYFNKDNLALDTPVQIGSVQMPYYYHFTKNGKTYVYEYPRQIWLDIDDNPKSDNDTSTPEDLDSLFPFRDMLVSTEEGVDPISLLKDIKMSYNTDSMQYSITGKSGRYLYLSSKDNPDPKPLYSLEYNGRTYETFYKTKTVLMDIVAETENVYDYFYIQKVKYLDADDYVVLLDLRLADEAAIASENAIPYVDGELVFGKEVYKPLNNDAKEYLSIVDNTHKLYFTENKIATETKTIDGDPLFLDAEGNEVKFNLGLTSQFQQHHDLFKAVGLYTNLTETLSTSMLTGIAGKVTQAGNDRLYAYTSATMTETYKLLTSVPTGKEIQYDYGSLETFIAEDYFRIFDTTHKDFSRSAKAYKPTDLFDLESENIAELTVNPKYIVKESDTIDHINGIYPDGYLIIDESKSAKLSEGFHIVQYTYVDVTSENKDSYTHKYIVYTDNNNQFQAIGYNNKNNAFKVSDIEFTLKEAIEQFGVSSILSQKQPEYTLYFYDEFYRCYYSKTLAVSIDDWSYQPTNSSQKQILLNLLLWFNMNRIIPLTNIPGLSIKGVSFKCQQKTSYYGKTYADTKMIQYTDFRNRFSTQSTSTDQKGRELAKSGQFKRARLNQLKTMNLEQYTRLTNETYEVTNANVDADAPMKMFIYMNGLNQFLKASQKIDEAILSKNQLVNWEDSDISLIIHKPINDYVSPVADYSDEISVARSKLESDAQSQNVFQRINNYQHYPLMKDQIESQILPIAVENYIMNSSDSSNVIYNILTELDRSLHEQTISRMSFSKPIINLYTGYYKFRSSEYPENFERFFEPKLYDDNGEFIPPVYSDRNDTLCEVEKYSASYDCDDETIKALIKKIVEEGWVID